MKQILGGLILLAAVFAVTGCGETVEVHDVYHHHYDEGYTTPGNPTPMRDEGAPDTFEAVPQQ